MVSQSNVVYDGHCDFEHIHYAHTCTCKYTKQQKNKAARILRGSMHQHDWWKDMSKGHVAILDEPQRCNQNFNHAPVKMATSSTCRVHEQCVDTIYTWNLYVCAQTHVSMLQTETERTKLAKNSN